MSVAKAVHCRENHVGGAPEVLAVHCGKHLEALAGVGGIEAGEIAAEALGVEARVQRAAQPSHASHLETVGDVVKVLSELRGRQAQVVVRPQE